MNCWDILDIEPTDDMVVIKRAYAEKLKLHHPEDDPEGFQQVRQAYENALRYTKYIKSSTTALIMESQSELQKDVVYQDQAPNAEVCQLPFNTNKAHTCDDLVEGFMKEVRVIYNSASSRKDVNQWKTLLESEAYWNLDVKRKLSHHMLSLLMEHYQLSQYRLPPAIWRLFNEHFFWIEQQGDLYNIFPRNFVDHITENIYSEQITLWHKVTNHANKYSHVFYMFFLGIIIVAMAIFFIAAAVSGARVSGIVLVFVVLRLLHAFWGNK